MHSKNTPPIEEISADQIEVIDQESRNSEKIRKISADDPVSSSFFQPGSGGNVSQEGNAFENLFENIEEFKKIRFFGPLSLLLSLVGFTVFPFYVEPVAIGLALFDIWKGSKFTRKISIFAMILATIALLNAWQ